MDRSTNQPSKPKKEIDMTTTTNVEIKRLNQVEVILRMVGTTPLYFNSMSAKTKRDLLIGGNKKDSR